MLCACFCLLLCGMVLGYLYNLSGFCCCYCYAETMEYDRNFEFEGFEKYIDKWRGLLQRYNKEMNGASKGRQNEILVKFQKVRAFQANIVMQLSFQLDFLVVVGSCCVLNFSNCGTVCGLFSMAIICWAMCVHLPL